MNMKHFLILLCLVITSFANSQQIPIKELVAATDSQAIFSVVKQDGFSLVDKKIDSNFTSYFFACDTTALRLIFAEHMRSGYWTKVFFLKNKKLYLSTIKTIKALGFKSSKLIGEKSDGYILYLSNKRKKRFTISIKEPSLHDHYYTIYFP